MRRKKTLNFDISRSPSSLVVVHFAGTVNSAPSPQHPEQVDMKEDGLIEDCVPKIQNMDRSLCISVDVNTIIALTCPEGNMIFSLHPAPSACIGCPLPSQADWDI